ncbi:hypothetical protein PanWU01x14_133840 [Parasponia andersonii]|uniref:Uncharacterized protein n=1 Tax=Parasponia andersonii TaxID=3476 RepID=A0A2P5CQ19_PARAD|nr:hypothetical protein PanWU01x14_133840 [Parasponia andersonii]
MSGNDNCMESSHKRFVLTSESDDACYSSSSAHVLRPSQFDPSVAAAPLLSIPRLFYEQPPSSSSTSPPGLISSFVSSPEQKTNHFEATICQNNTFNTLH